MAEQHPDSVAPVAAVIGEILGTADLTAHAAANLLEGAERADNALYARTCLSILQRHMRPGVTMQQLALLTYGIRHQGLMPEPMFDALRQTAAELPDRENAVATAATSQLTSDRLQRLTDDATLADTVRLLEATAGLVTLTPGTASEIYQRHPAPTDTPTADLYGRLIEALAAHLDEDQRLSVLGTFAARATIVTCADPTAVDVTVDTHTQTVTATIMHPPHPAPDDPGPEWDSTAQQPRDDANGHTMAVARRLAAACPEAAVCEVITLTPSGRRLLIADQEAGHKEMPRDAFHPRTSVRRSVGFQAAVRRLTASESWTQLITRQIGIANELVELVADAPARLNPADNAARRRQWSQHAEDIRARAGELSTQPVILGHDAARSHARADDADRETNKASEALIMVAETLPRLVHDRQWIGQAARLGDAAKKLLQAREASDPTLADLGRPIPDTLVAGVQTLAHLLTALHHHPTSARRLRGGGTRVQRKRGPPGPRGGPTRSPSCPSDICSGRCLRGRATRRHRPRPMADHGRRPRAARLGAPRVMERPRPGPAGSIPGRPQRPGMSRRRDRRRPWPGAPDRCTGHPLWGPARAADDPGDVAPIHAGLRPAAA